MELRCNSEHQTILLPARPVSRGRTKWCLCACVPGKFETEGRIAKHQAVPLPLRQALSFKGDGMVLGVCQHLRTLSITLPSTGSPPSPQVKLALSMGRTEWCLCACVPCKFDPEASIAKHRAVPLPPRQARSFKGKDRVVLACASVKE